MALFADRREAGRALAGALAVEAANAPIVVGLPRGGVVVAAEIARALDAPLDVVAVGKIGVPGHEELAMGAVAEGDVLFDDARTRRLSGVSRAGFERARERALEQLAARTSRLRSIRPREDVRGRTVIAVDDGVATGATAAAAIEALRAAGASRVVFAAPIALGHSRQMLDALADETVFLAEDEGIFSVGQAYVDFGEVDDRTVDAVLRELGAEAVCPATPRTPAPAGPDA